MKTNTCVLLPVVWICCVSGCTHVTMMGHVAAYDVNAEFKGDPITPVSMNAGFESHSFVAVPPENSLTPWENFDSDYLPVGDVLPAIAKLKIERVSTQDPWDGIAFDFVSSGATGEAAVAAAGGKPRSPTPDAVEVPMPDRNKAAELADDIKKITNDSSSIPVVP